MTGFPKRIVAKLLQCLPLCFRVDFKMLLVVFKSLQGLAPIELTDPFHPYDLLSGAQVGLCWLFPN